ncbi:MAG: hypothetical protein ACYSUB_00180 [Planctomycetota bacterium]
MQTKVINMAIKKLRAVRNSSVFIASAKISSKTAKETIKTTRGSRKATITLNTTEGPLIFPNCW